MRRRFLYMHDNTTERAVEVGEYEVPRQLDKKVADLALSFGFAVIVPKPKRRGKKAPENKSKKATETK